VDSNTLWANRAPEGGDLDTDGGSVSARNTILGNIAGPIHSLGHNLIGSARDAGGFLASDLLNVNPLLEPLQDNGGPTQTMVLLPRSPALDAGDNTNVPGTDQRGFPRIVGGTIDIGAYEVQPEAARRFRVTTPRQVTLNMPFDIAVTAVDG